MTLRFLMTISAIAMIAGCTNWETSSVTPSAAVNQENAFSAQNVKLSAGAYNAAGYVKVSDLEVSVNKATAFSPDPTVSLVEEKLKEEAYRLGATDVFEVRITDVGISLLSYGTRKGYGVAVKKK